MFWFSRCGGIAITGFFPQLTPRPPFLLNARKSTFCLCINPSPFCFAEITTCAQPMRVALWCPRSRDSLSTFRLLVGSGYRIRYFLCIFKREAFYCLVCPFERLYVFVCPFDMSVSALITLCPAEHQILFSNLSFKSRIKCY